MSCKEDVIILTPEGLIKITDIVNQNSESQTDVESFDIENCDYNNRIATIIDISNNLRYNKFLISEKFDNGKDNVLDITTSMGFNMCGTYDHQIVIINKNGNLKFKRLCDISQEDYIAICYNTNFFNGELKLKYYNRHKRNNSNYQILKNFQYMNESIARLLGYIISEGNASFVDDTAYRMMITTYDKEMQDDIMDICQNLGIDAYRKYNGKKNNGNPIGIMIHSVMFTDFIYHLGYKQYIGNGIINR